MEYITHTDQTLSARLAASERILIGIGPEWGLKSEKKKIRDCRLSDPEQAEIKAAYEALYEMVKDKDYYLVTTLTDGAVYDTPFDRERITAPCGNIHWPQCSRACTCLLYTSSLWHTAVVSSIRSTMQIIKYPSYSVSIMFYFLV